MSSTEALLELHGYFVDSARQSAGTTLPARSCAVSLLFHFGNFDDLHALNNYL
jgi:hypothetical protein